MKSKKGRLIRLLAQSPSPHIRYHNIDVPKLTELTPTKTKKISVDRQEVKTPLYRSRKKLTKKDSEYFAPTNRRSVPRSRNPTPILTIKSQISYLNNPQLNAIVPILSQEDKIEIQERVSTALKEKYNKIQVIVNDKLKEMRNKAVFPKAANTLRAESIFDVEIKKLETTFLPKILKQARSHVSLKRAESNDKFSSESSTDIKSNRSNLLRKLEENLIHRYANGYSLSHDNHETDIKGYQFYSEKVMKEVSETMLNCKVNPI